MTGCKYNENGLCRLWGNKLHCMTVKESWALLGIDWNKTWCPDFKVNS